MRGAFGLPGGDEQNRTVDPLLARQVLSQLSYTPILWCAKGEFPLHLFESPCRAFKIKQRFKLALLGFSLSCLSKLTLDVRPRIVSTGQVSIERR